MVQLLSKRVRQFLTRLDTHLPWLSNCTLEYSQRNADSCSQKKLYTNVQFVQFQCHSRGEWINCLWYAHTTEYYSVIIVQKPINNTCNKLQGAQANYTAHKKSISDYILYNSSYIIWSLLQLHVKIIHVNLCKAFTRMPQFSSVQSLSCVRLFATPWIAARQASLSNTNSRSSLKLTSIESVMPSSHLILCCPLLLLPPIPPSIRVFSNEWTLWTPRTDFL